MINVRHTILKKIFVILLFGVYTNAFAQGITKWKYLPKSLIKFPKIPAAINPRLKLGVQTRLCQTDIALEGAILRSLQQRTLSTQTPVTPSIPPQFTHFANWMDQLDNKRLLATNHTRAALARLRQGLTYYETLPASEQAQVNLAVITLNQLRNSKLGKFKNDDFCQLVYHAREGEIGIPKPEQFHVQLERRGMWKTHKRMRRAQQLNVQSFTFAEDYEDPNKIIGLTFFQGFQPDKARRELEQVLDTLTPPGYTIRMGAHELGLSNNRKKFRQGFLHMHFEQVGTRSEPIPTDMSIELWLGATPYAGVIDPKTRTIIAPFPDRWIARNYLILFNKYLSPEVKRVLDYIAR
ncbi:MAG: hypothetical protein IJ876_04045 [Elusimicrobiaceae bacterium]|nr:hypothetical protein [Elusimicrobiaceae bacterium]